MTIEDAIKKLDERLNKLKNGTVLRISASTVHAEYVERIFERGENTSGGRIGSYDDSSELWVDPSTLPRSVSPRSKPNSNKTAKKTVYFKSYRQLRSEVGRESSFVNLRLTNDMQSDISNSTDLRHPSITEISNGEFAITCRRPENRDKMKGMELKYGRVFGLTSGEVKLFNDTVIKEFKFINA